MLRPQQRSIYTTDVWDCVTQSYRNGSIVVGDARWLDGVDWLLTRFEHAGTRAERQVFLGIGIGSGMMRQKEKGIQYRMTTYQMKQGRQCLAHVHSKEDSIAQKEQENETKLYRMHAKWHRTELSLVLRNKKGENKRNKCNGLPPNHQTISVKGMKMQYNI